MNVTGEEEIGFTDDTVMMGNLVIYGNDYLKITIVNGQAADTLTSHIKYQEIDLNEPFPAGE